jgi:hypothetical protein
MNFFVKLFKKQVIRYIVGMMNDKVKKDWAEKVNEKVDLPGIDEKEEQKLFEATIDAGFDEIKKMLEKM